MKIVQALIEAVILIIVFGVAFLLYKSSICDKPIWLSQDFVHSILMICGTRFYVILLLFSSSTILHYSQNRFKRIGAYVLLLSYNTGMFLIFLYKAAMTHYTWKSLAKWDGPSEFVGISVAALFLWADWRSQDS